VWQTKGLRENSNAGLCDTGQCQEGTEPRIGPGVSENVCGSDEQATEHDDLQVEENSSLSHTEIADYLRDVITERERFCNDDPHKGHRGSDEDEHACYDFNGKLHQQGSR